ncbi:hypothetical protein [Methanimicrococcus hacksteinii]|nr:hypothetical protein [Methanimicrococcus sp. At1]
MSDMMPFLDLLRRETRPARERSGLKSVRKTNFPYSVFRLLFPVY